MTTTQCAPRPAARTGKVCAMERLVLIAVCEVGGLFGLLLAMWRIDRWFKRESAALHEITGEQDKQLAVVNAELQLARLEVSRLRSEVTALHHAVEYLVEGPPSMRAPSQQAS